MPKMKGFSEHTPLFKFLDRRRSGIRPYPGESNLFNSKLAQGLLNKQTDISVPYFQNSTTPSYRSERIHKGRVIMQETAIHSTGGIFNLEFSPDGRILSAACERKNILIFDPLTRQVVKSIENAHQDCVNCVRFLDTRTFASCSDDYTVALWDVRNLKTRVRTLQGHTNWVKNIEYSQHDNALVTSGFDGAIYTWDFNKYSETNPEFNKVFYTAGLMRMRLTPAADKMVISHMKGYLLVVHDLNLQTLRQDLEGFKPNLYRMMQLSGQPRELACIYTRLFHAKRNRIELISDFPDLNDADTISSLRIHPQGWVAVSRNTSADENSEWCCVHDIQSIDTREEDDELVKPITWRRAPAPVLPVLDSIDDVGGEVQRFRSGRIEIISTGARTSQGEDGNAVIHIDLRVRRRQRDNPDEDDDEAEGRDVDVENEDGGSEETNVDGTNFIAAESMAALDLLGELTRHRRDTDALNQDGGAGDRRQRHDTQADQPVRNMLDALRNIGGAAGASDRQDWLDVIEPVAEEEIEVEDNRMIRNDRRGIVIIGANGPRRVTCSSRRFYQYNENDFTRFYILDLRLPGEHWTIRYRQMLKFIKTCLDSLITLKNLIQVEGLLKNSASALAVDLLFLRSDLDTGCWVGMSTAVIYPTVFLSLQ
ncbi:uncharacterized protein LOC111699887 isoform X2 [Eurytemora carolleeae]|uniref:uncharacterized protein LOC111699887 isoform X2 n=1 Tax=Eurytemora carolleeae TaxID=1294199 RepID=UPI000C78959D|nr:uncharacterized protein LOC111699887 isoform X2 [Eurytemora carolleeae]|eukprot:XP_023326414.1 uncharacterized protein LOC111699887 isoform X2 [Eurytemora affinis]